uniref:Uncharacterized protein n=1 Tax=Clastoptera arizonana TaxID=38151 RepID=A0A1B6DCW6_9HEMI
MMVDFFFKKVRRRSLLALGTLRSHRDSFSDANATSPHNGIIINTNIEPDLVINNIGCEVENNCKQSSDTEWESEDSLPLDRSLPLPPPEIIITPDRRSRITLERTPSLDLTDDDHSDQNIKIESCTFGDENGIMEEIVISNSTLPNPFNNTDIEGNNIINVNNNVNFGNTIRNSKFIYDTGQIYQENSANTIEMASNITINNDTYTNILKNQSTENEVTDVNYSKKSYDKVLKLCSLDNLIDNSKYVSIESSFSCEQLDSESSNKLENICSESFSIDTLNNTELCSKDCDLAQSLDSLDESPFGTVVKRSVFQESHSLELLDNSSNLESGKPMRRHVRNKSITVNSNWSKSVDVLVKPSHLDKMAIDSKKIDAQLKCYDEALRELEQDKLMKIKSSKSLDSSSFLSAKKEHSDYKVFIAKAISDDNHKLDLSEDHNTITIQEFNKTTHYEIPKTFSVESDLKDISMSKNVCASNLMCMENPKDLYLSNVPNIQIQRKDETSSIIVENTETHNTEKGLNDVKSFSIDKSYNTVSKNKQITYPSDSNSVTVHLENVKNPISTFGEKSILDCSYKNKIFNQTKPIRKEKSESEIQNKTEFEKSNNNTKVKAVRSISMYVEQMKIKDELLKGSKFSRDDLMLSEKSESDSDWNEKPIRNKRKQLLAMRGIIADPKDSEDSNDEDPPFWLSTEKGGCFARQNTVVYQPTKVSTPQNSPEHGEQSCKNEVEEEIYKPEVGESKSSSSTSEVSDSASISQSDTTPRHNYTLRTHQKLLKDHLKTATSDKVKLEETVAQLRDQVDRLQYELADTSQHIVARDDKVTILQDELVRLGEKYSTALEDVHTLNYKLSLQEVELKYLRNVVKKENPDKGAISKDSTNNQLLDYLEEVIQANKHVQVEKEALINQNMADIKKLQDDTIHWKELYEEAISKLEHIQGLNQPNFQSLGDFDSFKQKDIYDKKSMSQDYNQNKAISSCSLDSEDTQIKNKNCKSKAGGDKHKLKSTFELKLEKTPIHFNVLNDVNIDPQNKQVDFERKKQSSLDSQISHLMNELQKKLGAEIELDNLYRKIETDYVTKEQLKQMQSKYIEQIQQIKLENEIKLETKIEEMNKIIESQVIKQIEREKMEFEMKKEFEYARQKLQFELSKAHAALKAKESEKKALKTHCKKLTLDVEKSEDLKRKELIEKAYSVNLADPSTEKEKELYIKKSFIPPPPPPLPPITTSMPESLNPFSASSLRQQLEHSIRKHRDLQKDQSPNGHHC